MRPIGNNILPTNILNKMKSVDKLLEIMKALRAPDGCPWDKVQTHKSIRSNVVEECAEFLEAVDLDSPAKMREELGDLLMLIALNCQIAAENKEFTFDDVVNEINEKIVRRHPHVFGDQKAADSDDVLKIWQQVKNEEKKELAIGGVFDGIPPALSALRYAVDVAKKAPEELVEKADANADTPALQTGKKLFEIVAEASAQKIDPEGALRDYLNLMRRAQQ